MTWSDVLARRGSGQAAARSGPGASKAARGSTRPSGFGSHQFHLPINSIVAGTRLSRTTVASRAIATARPRPSSLTDGTPAPAHTAHTAATIKAALEIVLGDAARPRGTEWRAAR